MSTKSDSMQDIFRRSGFELTTYQLDQFRIYHELLMEHNESLDLTRITAFEDIVIKHFVDSIYFTNYVPIPSPIIDIGTGAGFPGIPLKIVQPECKVILAEPRKKRAAFLELVVKELRIEGIEVYPHMVTNKSFFSVQGVITRALETIDDTLARVNHFLPQGGRVLLMKGPEADEDLAALSPENRNAYSTEADHHYTLPFTTFKRRIIVYKKEVSATMKTYVIMKNLTATAGTAITSGENKKFKEYKKLCDADGIRKTGLALVAGKKIITEIVHIKKLRTVDLIICDGYSEGDDAMNALIADLNGSGKLSILKKSLFNEIDVFNARSPLLVVEIPEMREWDLRVEPGCSVLIPFQDPVNVGSAIRSAVGFNAARIIMLREAAHPFHPKAVRASAGSVFNTTLLRGPSLHDLPEMLKNNMPEIIALDKSGRPISDFTFPERFLLLPGLEGPGLPESLKVQSVSIPLGNDVESLNAPVALSIALYEWNKSYSPSN